MSDMIVFIFIGVLSGFIAYWLHLCNYKLFKDTLILKHFSYTLVLFIFGAYVCFFIYPIYGGFGVFASCIGGFIGECISSSKYSIPI